MRKLLTIVFVACFAVLFCQVNGFCRAPDIVIDYPGGGGGGSDITPIEESFRVLHSRGSGSGACCHKEHNIRYHNVCGVFFVPDSHHKNYNVCGK